MKKIRHGVIGLGGISATHIRNIAELNGIEVTAIYDRNAKKLDAMGEEMGIEPKYRFNDYNELIACPDVDSISICTPNFQHFAMVKKAIEEGKSFAVEKPLALTREECEELVQLMDEKPVKHMLCFSYRFMPAARYAKWIVQNGKIGKIRHVYVQYLQGWGNDMNRPMTWRFDKKLAGSGALGDLGSHVIDLTRFIVGEISEVCADSGIIVPQRRQSDGTMGEVTVDDYAQFLAHFENGATSTFAISRFAYGFRNLQRIEIYGSEGGIIYTQDLINGVLTSKIETCIGDVAFMSNHFTETPVPQNFLCGEMDAYVRRLNGDESGMAATVYDGYEAQKVMDAVLRSADSRGWEKII